MTTTGGTTTVAYTRDALDRITERKVTGTKIGTTATFDPNGNQTSGTTADNSTGNLDNRWLGQYQRPTETEPGLEPIIEMGARQYSPRLGRFLETDPVTGGSANAYAYTFGDPTNTNDITGKCPECAWVALFVAFAEKFPQGDLLSAILNPSSLEALAPPLAQRVSHSPQPSRHGAINFGVVFGKIVEGVTWVKENLVKIAHYSLVCYQSGQAASVGAGVVGFWLFGPPGEVGGAIVGGIGGGFGGVMAADNGGNLG